MKQIPLTKGKIALVDDEDYEEVSAYNWYAHYCPFGGGTWYAYYGGTSHGERIRLKMHRMIMNAPDDTLIDHVDHDGLNNQKSNLRLCSKTENGQNRKGPTITNPTGYRGVSVRQHTKRFMARICVNGKSIYLGYYNTPSEAHSAFEEAARKYFGDFYGG